MLLVDSNKQGFNLDEVCRGTLIYARHKTWPEGQAGIVTGASEEMLRVQYLPSIQNVQNHYLIHASEASDWKIRYSNDGMETIQVYPEKDEGEE